MSPAAPILGDQAGMRLTRLQASVVGLVALALGAWTVAAVLATPTRPPGLRPLLLISLLVLVWEVIAASARQRVELFSFPGGEAAVVVGLVLLGPLWLVAVAPLVLLAGQLLTRRGAAGSVYAAATFTVAASVAAGVAATLGTPAAERPAARDLLVLVLAAAAFRCTGHLTNAAAAAVAQQRSLRQVAAAGIRSGCDDWAAGLAVSAGCLLVIDPRTQSALSAPLGLLAVLVLCHGYASTRRESRLWRRLEAATSGLNQRAEIQVAEAALRSACRLFGAEGGELVLAGSGCRPPRVYSSTPAGGVRCRRGSSAPVPTAPRVAAPLMGPAGELGSLQLAFAAPVSLSGRERQALRSFAQSVATAVLRVGWYDDLRAGGPDLVPVHRAAREPVGAVPQPRSGRSVPGRRLRDVEG